MSKGKNELGDIWQTASPPGTDIIADKEPAPISLEEKTNPISAPSIQQPILSAQAIENASLPEKIETKEQMNSLDNRIEQSITGKNTTVQRLMEAAKRGQTGGHPAVIAAKKTLLASVAQSTQPIQQVPSPQSVQFSQSVQPMQPIQSDATMPGSEGQNDNSQLISQSHSGWYAVYDTKSTSSSPGMSEKHDEQAPFASEVAPPSPSIKEPDMVSSSTAMPKPKVSQPSSISSSVLRDMQAAAREPVKQTAPQSDKVEDEKIYTKQKYRNTLSRLQAPAKANRFDNLLVTTRARAAALQADVSKPPLDLWRLAIAIVTAACLLASVYVVYAALTVPIPPVTSVETLMVSGNYEQVMDILEGKSLSTPLTRKEKDQLNYVYLAMAKSYYAKGKQDKALSLLTKVDLQSPYAMEANQLKDIILQSKKAVLPKYSFDWFETFAVSSKRYIIKIFFVVY